MPLVICENTNCKYISKRRKMVLNGNNQQILCHTCRADIVSIGPLVDGESIEEHMGYQPYECMKWKNISYAEICLPSEN